MTKQARGFTLLEILVAFVMLALVGGALLQLFQGGLRNIGSSADISHAALLARSKLAELQAIKTLSAGSQSGQFSDGYRWKLDLSPYTQEDGINLPESNLHALSATLDIEWEQDRRYRINTLLLSKSAAP